MAEFKVDFSGMQSGVERQKQLETMLRQIQQEVSDINHGLEFKVAAKEQIQSKLNRADIKMDQLHGKLGSMRTGLETSLQKYRMTENKVIMTSRGKLSNIASVARRVPSMMDTNGGLGNIVPPGVVELSAVAASILGNRGGIAAGAEKQNWWDKLKGGVEKAFGNVVKAGKDCVSALAENFNNKGITYTLFQYGKAAVKVVGGIMSVSAAIGSGGLLAPLALTYGANEFASGIVDAIKITDNLFQGKTAEIEETDILRDVMSMTGGYVGRALGNEEAGTAIGEGIYHTGKIINGVYTVGTTMNKIHQAPDFNFSGIASESQNTLRGIWQLAAHTDIGVLKYQTQLFKYTIPHTTQAVKNICMVYQLGSSLIGKPGEIVTNVISGKSDIWGGLYGNLTGMGETAAKVF